MLKFAAGHYSFEPLLWTLFKFAYLLMDTLDNIICISWFRGKIKSVMGPKCPLQPFEAQKRIKRPCVQPYKA
jgi:hypothetical protein